MNTIACLYAVLVGILLAPRTGMAAESSAWQLRFRDGAGDLLQNQPAQIAKTNGIGTRNYTITRNEGELKRCGGT